MGLVLVDRISISSMTNGASEFSGVGFADLLDANYLPKDRARAQAFVDAEVAIMRDITVSTIWETGNPFPAWEDVVDWAGENPDDARRIFERYLRKSEE